MRNVPGQRWHGSSVSIHGPALRHIRQLTGLTTHQLAEEAGITPDYLRKIELGYNRTVAPNVFVALNVALRIDDRRVLLADPFPVADDEPLVADLPAATGRRPMTGRRNLTGT